MAMTMEEETKLLATVVAAVLVFIAFVAMYNTLGGLLTIFEGLIVSLVSVVLIMTMAIFVNLTEAARKQK